MSHPQKWEYLAPALETYAASCAAEWVGER
jgi:hypothetical protein